jgi:flagellar biosynthesis protein FliQ
MVESIVQQSFVLLLLAALPLIGVTLVLGVFSLFIQSLTLVREESLLQALRVVVLFITVYVLFPGLQEQAMELFRLCFAYGDFY